MSRVNCEWREEKVASEVLMKYDVYAKYDDISDTTMPRHNSTNLEAEISCAYIKPKQKCR
jgi:hexokinase